MYLRGYTGLTEMPDGLSVGRSLFIKDCTELKTLPKNLRVGTDLYLRGCTALMALPDGLSLGKDLYIKDCTELTALPKNLRVVGDSNLKRLGL